MSQQLGETREMLGWAVIRKVEEIVNANKGNVKPFYIIYAAKVDPALRGAQINGQIAAGGFRDCYLTSFSRPQPAFGQLVWFVDNSQGKIEFVHDLSLPPDIPVDPSLLSDKAEDQLYTVMEKGKKYKALVS